MGQISLHDCDHIRELCSASVDGELSELDDARVQSHLAACPGCRAFAATAAQSSRLVRETPLDDLNIRIVMPSRRLAIARRLQVASAAAAVAVTVGLTAVVSTMGTSSSPLRPSPVREQVSNLRFPDQELRLLERTSHPRSHTRLAL
jgi:predicted anti-sigma-YlaC factor YlaD